MFRCYLLHFICEKHIPNREPFLIILQTPPDEVDKHAGSCDWLMWTPATVECERSLSDKLPSKWRDLLMSPPAVLHGRV
ncbi:MAG: hypothetical protein Q7T57_04905, partial [Dehalococcoidales bacterium]|nr:hypothetical protein [Dehalococcoidales bacterium]